MNDYYDVSIKEWRLKEIEKCVSEHSESTYVLMLMKTQVQYLKMLFHPA